MSSYEVLLLIGSLAGAMGILALASVFLDRGSVRIMAFFVSVAGGNLYLAHQSREEGLNMYDLPAAINNLISQFS